MAPLQVDEVSTVKAAHRIKTFHQEARYTSRSFVPTMFKSGETGTRREHILLRVSRPEVEALRKVALANELLCPECETPVWVKAGEIKSWHFAHSIRKDCPLQNESASLLRVRALLYSWLETKFPGQVAIEVKPGGGERLPRPIDYVLTTARGVTIAFWIVEKAIRSLEKRWDIQAGMQNIRTVRWILLSSMLRVNPSDPTELVLSTTERELIVPTPYDGIYSEQGSGGSLHYLDAETGCLTTCRALRKLHGEHGYKAHLLTDMLDAMLITPKGELVHLGEYKRRQEWVGRRDAINKLVEEAEDDQVARQKGTGGTRPEGSGTVGTFETARFACTECQESFGPRDVSNADFAKRTCLCPGCAGLPTRPLVSDSRRKASSPEEHREPLMHRRLAGALSRSCSVSLPKRKKKSATRPPKPPSNHVSFPPDQPAREFPGSTPERRTPDPD